MRGQGGQDIVLRNDMKNYRKAWEKMRTAEKINNERALEHRLLWEKLKKINPNPTVSGETDRPAAKRRASNIAFPFPTFPK